MIWINWNVPREAEKECWSVKETKVTALLGRKLKSFFCKTLIF